VRQQSTGSLRSFSSNSQGLVLLLLIAVDVTTLFVDINRRRRVESSIDSPSFAVAEFGQAMSALLKVRQQV
jgi:hypothetical protein